MSYNIVKIADPYSVYCSGNEDELSSKNTKELIANWLIASDQVRAVIEKIVKEKLQSSGVVFCQLNSYLELCQNEWKRKEIIEQRYNQTLIKIIIKEDRHSYWSNQPCPYEYIKTYAHCTSFEIIRVIFITYSQLFNQQMDCDFLLYNQYKESKEVALFEDCVGCLQALDYAQPAFCDDEDYNSLVQTFKDKVKEVAMKLSEKDNKYSLPQQALKYLNDYIKRESLQRELEGYDESDEFLVSLQKAQSRQAR